MIETEAPGKLRPDDARLEIWRSFLTAHARLFRRLDDELRSEHALSLPEYDALLQLARAPERRLRMSRLAARVLLSKSGVTRLIDRLERDGFVERTQCSHDARGAEAVLTAAGLARLRVAATTHLAGVERYFLAPLGAAELSALERSMITVLRAVGDVAEPDAACEPAARGQTSERAGTQSP